MSSNLKFPRRKRKFETEKCSVDFPRKEEMVSTTLPLFQSNEFSDSDESEDDEKKLEKFLQEAVKCKKMKIEVKEEILEESEEKFKTEKCTTDFPKKEYMVSTTLPVYQSVETYVCAECENRRALKRERQRDEYYANLYNRLISEGVKKEDGKLGKKTPEPIEITVRSITREDLKLQISPKATILDLKLEIAKAKGWPLSFPYFVYRHRKTLDDDTLEELGLPDDPVIYMVLRLRGC